MISRFAAGGRTAFLPLADMTPPVTVNVLDFGAVADGATDCSTAFRKAIDALDPRIGDMVEAAE